MESRQILTPTQEVVLKDWVGHHAVTAKPFDSINIWRIAYDMMGVVPSKNWHQHFENRHPEIASSKPSNLDPKCAQNFNQANISLLSGVF